jgi:2-dehydro-3-deoxygluconokinase
VGVSLTIKPATQARWDCVALGEVMLRLDPGATRIRTARTFDVWEGGGEYNVARSLRRCFGLRTAAITALVDNDVGRLVETLMQAGGVDTRHVCWQRFDGFGNDARVGLNFTERGFGLRPARTVYDRGHTAAAAMRPGDVDWTRIFGDEGVRWLHTGGIFAALSPSTAEVIQEAVQAAKQSGTVVSYDLNYRAGLWANRGGRDRAIEVNRALAPYVDVMLGNEEDFSAALGFTVEGVDDDLSELDPTNFKTMIDQVVSTYPGVRVVATTLRRATTASRNDWSAVAFADGAFHSATPRTDLEVFDRVGGGDGFASGLIYALLSGKPVAAGVEYGAAHGALAMTTPGDTSMVSLDEVEAAMRARTVRAVR